jgi:hypothetical protein
LIQILGEKPKASKVLKSAFFTVILNSVCAQIFEKNINELYQKYHPGAPHHSITIPQEIICADGESTNSIACKGDSGGKVILKKYLCYLDEP